MMTNQERRDRIKALSDMINPLQEKKLITSLRYNFLTNPYKQPNGDANAEIKELNQRLEELTHQITPLFTELRSLQVKYVVEYDGEVIQDGMSETIPNKRIFYLSTSVDIDSYKEQIDYQNPDVLTLLNELKDYIYLREYSQFTIQHIKKL